MPFPVMLVTLQVGIFGVVLDHDFVDVPGPFVGVIFLQAQEAFQALIGFLANKGVGLPRLGVDGGRLRVPQFDEYERAGVDLLLLQFSPQHEEMERFGREVISARRRSN